MPTLMNKEKNNLIYRVYLLGLLFFLFSAIYSIIFYQEKFMIDATSFLFTITNDEWFPSSQQREVMYLQQFFPVIMVKLGASLKTVMISYVVNNYLLYFIIFSIIVLFLRDIYAAIFFLIVQIGASPVSYFLIGAELIPGCALAILLISTLLNIDHIKHKKTAYLLTLTLVFLTIRSHPLVTVCFFAMLAIFYIDNKIKFNKNKILYSVLISISVLLMIQKSININEYEKNYIITSVMAFKVITYYSIKYIWLVFLIMGGGALILYYINNKKKQLPQWSIITLALFITLLFTPLLKTFFNNINFDINTLAPTQKFIIHLFYGRVLFTFTTCYLLLYFFSKRKYRVLLSFSVVFACYCMLMYSVMDFSVINIDKSYTKLESYYSTIAHDTWGIPLRIIVFAVFFLIIVPKYKLSKSLKVFYTTIIIYIAYNLMIIQEVKAVSRAYIEQTTEIIDSCIENNIYKGIINTDDLHPDIPLLDHVYQDVIIFSSLLYDTTIHVIYKSEIKSKQYLEIDSEKVLLEESAVPVLIEDLNDNYYNIESEPYQVISFEIEKE